MMRPQLEIFKLDFSADLAEIEMEKQLARLHEEDAREKLEEAAG